jgi:hypothetical protein
VVRVVYYNLQVLQWATSSSVSTPEPLCFENGHGWYENHNIFQVPVAVEIIRSNCGAWNICMLWFLHRGKPYPTQKRRFCMWHGTYPCLCCVLEYLQCVCVCLLSLYGDHMCDSVPPLCMACFSDPGVTGLFSVVLTVGCSMGQCIIEDVHGDWVQWGLCCLSVRGEICYWVVEGGFWYKKYLLVQAYHPLAKIKAWERLIHVMNEWITNGMVLILTMYSTRVVISFGDALTREAWIAFKLWVTSYVML